MSNTSLLTSDVGTNGNAARFNPNFHEATSAPDYGLVAGRLYTAARHPHLTISKSIHCVATLLSFLASASVTMSCKR